MLAKIKFMFFYYFHKFDDMLTKSWLFRFEKKIYLKIYLWLIWKMTSKYIWNEITLERHLKDLFLAVKQALSQFYESRVLSFYPIGPIGENSCVNNLFQGDCGAPYSNESVKFVKEAGRNANSIMPYFSLGKAS